MSRGIRIDTDYTDYYDYLSTNDSPLFIYRRKYSDSMSRDKALNFIRKMDIQTIKLGLPREFLGEYDRVVVYTNTKLHQFKGKQIMSTHTATNIYPSYLASPYYTETQGVTIKYLQVGSRRFRIAFDKSIEAILEGDITSIQELETGFNYQVQLPIFSLDYIYNGKEMICVDYNEVQHLENIGLDKIMKPEEVIEEIKKAMLAYNL